jgi:hypothetical protein
MFGSTPLIIAAMMPVRKCVDNTVFIRLLLEAGADPFMEGQKEMTANDHAVDFAQHVLLVNAMALWEKDKANAINELTKKFMIAKRLRQGTQTAQGYTLELPSRDLTEGLIRKAEYDNLCVGLQTNLGKPGVIALAKSLRIPTSNQTKSQLCTAIAKRLTI